MVAVLLEQKGFFSDDCEKKENIYTRKKIDPPPSAEATLITSQERGGQTRQVCSSTLERPIQLFLESSAQMNRQIAASSFNFK